FATGPAESDVKPVVGERIWTSCLIELWSFHVKRNRVVDSPRIVRSDVWHLPPAVCQRPGRPASGPDVRGSTTSIRDNSWGKSQPGSFYKHIERWRNQPIEGEFPYVFLDGGSGVIFHPV